ncbi:hypothetical protein LQF12_09270 [Ruania suaedae]|uniref:hypothetical protein n=1 Tax=Ruania suaedae TaxID=2897774 RepID=UPI001E4D116F|nr:hypothetical protein [Ruania suaedae]UFU01716.1 hypothetical protein LQF12_09270 [Ruania suaedae]
MGYRFNPPPGWPTPPAGWEPPQGWQPDPTWPPAPHGWEFWLPDDAAAAPQGGDRAQPEGEVAPEPGPGTQHPTEQFQPEPPQQPEQSQPTEQAQPTEQFPPAQFPQSQPTQQFPPPQQSQQFPGAAPGPFAPGQDAAAGHHPPQGPGSYAGSYASAPPPGSGGTWGGGDQPGYPGGPGGPGGPGWAGASGSGPGEPRKNRTGLVIGAVIVGVIVVVGGIALALSLIFGDDEDTATPVSPTTTSEPTEEPTDDPTTDAPTDDPTTDAPTEEPTDDGGDTPTIEGDVELLAPSEPALVVSDGTPIVEVRLLEVERNWEPEAGSMMCSDPEGEYVAMQFEFTTLPELADYSEGTWSFVGFETGLLDTSGNKIADVSGIDGLFCLDQSQTAPSEMQPGETYTGWALMDAPREPGGILWEPWLDFTGSVPTYAWDLADY